MSPTAFDPRTRRSGIRSRTPPSRETARDERPGIQRAARPCASTRAAPASRAPGRPWRPTLNLPDDVQGAVEQLHRSGKRAVAIASGAGSRAFAWLHAVPGSSRTVVELVSAYSRASMAAWLGAAPASSADPGTAAALARAARARGLALGEPSSVIGVALVAAIASDSPRRADPRISVAVCGARGVRVQIVVLAGDAGDEPALDGACATPSRSRHEDIASRLLINALSSQADLPAIACPLAGEERVETLEEPVDGLVLAVLGGNLAWFVAPQSGPATAEGPPPRALLAGSFDPLHDGHRGLARAAARELGCAVGYELALVNADKGQLDVGSALERIAQFAGATLVVDRASTFVNKAQNFPGTTFVVGYDTAVRVLDPAYYGGSEGRDQALAQIARCGGDFLVAGRAVGTVFRPAESLAPPSAYARMFRPLGEGRFRQDVSSTELRQLGRAATRTDRVEEGPA